MSSVLLSACLLFVLLLLLLLLLLLWGFCLFVFGLAQNGYVFLNRHDLFVYLSVRQALFTPM